MVAGIADSLHKQASRNRDVRDISVCCCRGDRSQSLTPPTYAGTKKRKSFRQLAVPFFGVLVNRIHKPGGASECMSFESEGHATEVSHASREDEDGDLDLSSGV